MRAHRDVQKGMGVTPPVHFGAELAGRFVRLRPRHASDLIRRDSETSGETKYAPPLFRSPGNRQPDLPGFNMPFAGAARRDSEYPNRCFLAREPSAWLPCYRLV